MKAMMKEERWDWSWAGDQTSCFRLPVLGNVKCLDGWQFYREKLRKTRKRNITQTGSEDEQDNDDMVTSVVISEQEAGMTSDDLPDPTKIRCLLCQQETISAKDLAEKPELQEYPWMKQGEFVQCNSCQTQYHLPCLADVLNCGDGTHDDDFEGPLIPDRGWCPSCENELRWSDAIAELWMRVRVAAGGAATFGPEEEIAEAVSDTDNTDSEEDNESNSDARNTSQVRTQPQPNINHIERSLSVIDLLSESSEGEIVVDLLDS